MCLMQDIYPAHEARLNIMKLQNARSVYHQVGGVLSSRTASDTIDFQVLGIYSYHQKSSHSLGHSRFTTHSTLTSPKRGKTGKRCGEKNSSTKGKTWCAPLLPLLLLLSFFCFFFIAL